MSPCGVNVRPSTDVRNLGVLFDETLSLKMHVTQLVGRCYGWLRRIRSCRRALTQSAAIILVNSFITARIDYCNSLLAGCGQQQMDKLQRVINCAARVIYNCSRRDHVMPLLRDNLHWLRVWERILFKLCLMVYKALSGFAPSYITELCVPVASIGSHSSLRSAAHGTLFVPRTRLELGKRAFVIAAPARGCLKQSP